MEMTLRNKRLIEAEMLYWQDIFDNIKGGCKIDLSFQPLCIIFRNQEYDHAGGSRYFSGFFPICPRCPVAIETKKYNCCGVSLNAYYFYDTNNFQNYKHQKHLIKKYILFLKKIKGNNATITNKIKIIFNELNKKQEKYQERICCLK